MGLDRSKLDRDYLIGRLKGSISNDSFETILLKYE